MQMISKKVRERRKARKHTQQQIAEMAGVALNVVKAIEAGRPNVTLSSLQKVLDLFGLHLKVDDTEL